MVRLQYFNGKEWETIDEWYSADLAWVSLGADTFNYRVIDKDGKVLKEDTKFETPPTGHFNPWINLKS